MGRLTEAEYKATMGAKPRTVDPGAAPPFDLSHYLCGIEPEDWDGHLIRPGEEVAAALLMPGARWEHVLLPCEAPNVFMVIVIDREQGQVYGHHLLDLNRLYGLSAGHDQAGSAGT